MKLRSLAAALALTLASSAHAQTIEMRSGPYTIYADGASVTVDVAPGAIQEFKVTGPSRIQYTAKQVVLTLGDPGPPPTPTPPEPPGPTPPAPPPTPTWGPLDRIIILCETSKLTGREPFYALDVRNALTEIAPKDSAGLARWRCWDKDIPSPDDDWDAFLAFAKQEYKASGATTPVLYAFDKDKRHKTIDMSETAAVGDMVAKIRGLGVN